MSGKKLKVEYKLIINKKLWTKIGFTYYKNTLNFFFFKVKVERQKYAKIFFVEKLSIVYKAVEISCLFLNRCYILSDVFACGLGYIFGRYSLHYRCNFWNGATFITHAKFNIAFLLLFFNIFFHDKFSIINSVFVICLLPSLNIHNVFVRNTL